MSLTAGRPSKNSKPELDSSGDMVLDKKKVRVNFNLDEDKYIALKKYSLDSRKTVTQLITEMIDDKLIER